MGNQTLKKNYSLCSIVFVFVCGLALVIADVPRDIGCFEVVEEPVALSGDFMNVVDFEHGFEVVYDIGTAVEGAIVHEEVMRTTVLMPPAILLSCSPDSSNMSGYRVRMMK